ncbi:putative AfsR-like transcriptional regulator [Streptomyces albus]|uniref:Putative AfsR-like transcriptional regulator n=1 Tax=Streptomyces albus (strain ATCC 21838 / DSM 41398 / FERM P-419 / JCM 4703 / NBRC 107858) TaxID=1081613 RepID=A0A0B5ERF1_STRA4|nr:putative AfsR-like transcriptional regulator [Streptomyces albus]AOU75636.1 putative AfsR-like transcriptional regulator [Streptomyces albus]AYN31439.1 AfsR family transcriptional regulator [Streptomyces albus]
MRFQLLGPLSIANGDETAVLKPSKPTSLLAALLLHPNSVVSTGYLLRALWDEEQPATARAALQTCVLRLRRIFAKYGIDGAAIESVPGGYRMHASDRTLDLVRFRALADTPAGEDAEGELYRLKEALALWHGPLLANVASRMLHRDALPGLVEERLRVLERVCDLELAAGQCRQVLVDLWDTVRDHPGRERFAEQLIEALYRTGRQAEALAEYRAVKERLHDELGIDPGPGLQRLELAILRAEDLGPLSPAPRAALPAPARAQLTAAGTPSAALVGAPEEPAPAGARPARVAATATALTVQVPRTVTAAVPAAPAPRAVPGFTGRVRERAELARRLLADGGEGALVVVSGAPGIGKTALALQTAHEVRDSFPGGVTVVTMSRPDGSVLTSEEAAAQLRPAEPDTGRRLLVLDDVASGWQVRPLLPAPEGAAVLLTSRRGLAAVVATHGGAVHRLDVLPAADSRSLLAALLGEERTAAEPRATAELAELCGHFPLALRIAAARLLTRPGLTVAACLDWLAGNPPARLTLAEDPRLSVPAVLGQALDALDPEAGAAFLHLGAEADGGIVHPADVPERFGDAETVLEQLAEAGLLEDGPPGPYRMHSFLQLYARWHHRTKSAEPAAVPH